MDPTTEEQLMKRTAIAFAIAAAFFVAPSAASAANRTAQFEPQVVAQVVQVQRVSAAVTAQRVTGQRKRALRLTQLRAHLR
jgi:hypothetical protein